MRRPLIIIFTVLGLFGIGLGFLTFAPAVLVLPIASFYLDDLGFQLVELEQLQLGTEVSTANSVRIESDGLVLSASGIEAQYNLDELMDGQMQSLTIARLTLELATSDSSPSASTNQPAPELLELLNRIPIDEISILELAMEPALQQLDIQIGLQTQPLRLTANASYGQNQQGLVELQLQSTDGSSLSGTLVARFQGETLSESTLALSQQDQNLAIELDSTISLSILQNIPQIQLNLSSYDLATESLSVNSQLSITNPFSRPSMPEFMLVLDSPDSLLRIGLQADANRDSAQLQLPLLVSGSARSLFAGIDLAIGDSRAIITRDTVGRSFRLDTTLSDMLLRCEQLTACVAGLRVSSDSSAFQFGPVQADTLSFGGDLNLSYTDSLLELTASAVELSTPSLDSPFAASSLDFSVQNLLLIFADQLRGTFSFSSNSIDPGFDNFSLQSPSLAGAVRIAGDRIGGSVEFSVRNQLKINANVDHDLSTNQGRAEFDLPSYGFSSLTPLSSLVEQTLLEMDMVAGTISGQGEVQWQQQDNQDWEISGPLALTLENLSGFYEDNFFVDLSTELQAELSSPFTLRSQDSLAASIATVDVGLPLNKLEWRYVFDSTARQFRIDDFNSEVLGGNISVAEFDYDAAREENMLEIVLAGLNLESIVGLANYPSLTIDGLVSGYLPLIFSDNKLIIEQGLVGALNPGGRIQYTPANPVPSSNSTVQLVNDALSNYQYEILNTDVFYDENGDLRLEVQLQGANPDMNGGQQINLNVNIIDNIPTLLRSLQASRAITDALEQSLSN